MNKLMTVVVAAVGAASFSLPGFAEPEAAASAEESEATEAEETSVFEAGFDYDFLSAFVWRNAVQNRDLVMQPCIWADLTYFDPFYLGFSIWQNYDVTSRRRDVYRQGLNETDYNVHAGVTLFESEDEERSVGLEIGHEWYTYQGVRDAFIPDDETDPEAGGYWLRDDYPDTRELYVKLNYDNPFVNVYGQVSWMYEDFGNYRQGIHYEIGFNREVELCDSLTLGADWNVNFGDQNYLYYLYGGTRSGAYDHNDDPTDPDIYDDYASKPSGLGGTTVKLYLNYDLTDWLQVGATIAYTGVLNGDSREALGEQPGYLFGDDYPRDLLWGGLSVRLSY